MHFGLSRFRPKLGTGPGLPQTRQPHGSIPYQPTVPFGPIPLTLQLGHQINLLPTFPSHGETGFLQFEFPCLREVPTKIHGCRCDLQISTQRRPSRVHRPTFQSPANIHLIPLNLSLTGSRKLPPLDLQLLGRNHPGSQSRQLQPPQAPLQSRWIIGGNLLSTQTKHRGPVQGESEVLNLSFCP